MKWNQINRKKKQSENITNEETEHEIYIVDIERNQTTRNLLTQRMNLNGDQAGKGLASWPSCI